MSKRMLYCFSKEISKSTIPAINHSQIDWEKVGSIYVATSTLPLEVTKNLPEYAFMYQQIAQRLHHEVDMVPLPFPTVVAKGQLASLIVSGEKKITSLIEKYGNISEHSFYVKPQQPIYKVPETLEGTKEGLSYLRQKHERFHSENHLDRLIQEIEESIKAIFAPYLEDHRCVKHKDALGVHLLCSKKEGFSSAQLRQFGHSLKESATVKEMGVFPPFHFVDFTTFHSTP